MSQCSKLLDYLARLLEGRELTEFESHIDKCEKCQEAIEDATIVDGQVGDWLGSLAAPTVSDSNMANLVARAEKESTKRIRWKIIAPLAAAACLAVILGYLMLTGSDQTSPNDSKEPIAKTAPTTKILLNDGGRIEPATRDHGDILEVLDNGQLQVMAGEDRISVAAESRVEVMRIGKDAARFKLLKGTVKVEAKHRPATRLLKLKLESTS